MRTKRATIDDVARLAGVSIKTVSRVLNREPKVRQVTRERVHEAMTTLEYRPNSSARQLAARRTYLIGLVYSAGSSYITSIQNGVLEACRNEHYDLLIHPCRYDEPSLASEIRELITAPRVDGLVLTQPVADVAEVRETIEALDAATVTISSAATEIDPWSVGTDDFEISAEMTRYLVRLGHQRIAFIKGHPDHHDMVNRFEGFRSGLIDSGIKPRKAYCRSGHNNFESGVDEALRLLRQRERPTAIMCANDHMAAGVMKVAHEMGLSMPGDLSVTGFDDIPLASQIWPQLSTVRQPLRQMADEAARLLIERLRGTRPGKRGVLVPSKLVIRDSSGPAPA